MPWCPKCKSEYREGIKECADCKIPLVEQYNEELFKMTQDQAEMLAYQHMAESYADKLDELNLDETPQTQSGVHVYQNKKTKAEDFKSSAYTLTFVGILGMVALILMELQVIPVKLYPPGKYITYVVMGGLFLIFIICGIRSFFTFKKYEKEAEQEDDHTKAILDYAKQTITKESVVAMAGINENLPEEMKYFKYSEIIKKMIIQEFGPQDLSFLESISEEIYGRIFE